MSVAEQQPGTFAAWPRLLRAWRDLAERVTNALLDPKRRDKTVIALLIAFAAVWALYSILSRGSRDIYFDIGEIIGWSHRPSLAYHHPPMSVWVGQAWFSVFPVEDWSAYLLAAVWIALTLWISWRLFSEWLDDTKRVFALAMLTLIPLHTFHASLFNANAVQMVFWSAATLFFLRAFRTHE
ncbi:MAG TPA: glycosyltransferase family 39 protein, partial [Burkholderiales bacterium]|nr:glycosyltransferase family 39 protein [Burkholderiales bacterium]